MQYAKSRFSHDVSHLTGGVVTSEEADKVVETLNKKNKDKDKTVTDKSKKKDSSSESSSSESGIASSLLDYIIH